MGPRVGGQRRRRRESRGGFGQKFPLLDVCLNPVEKMRGGVVESLKVVLNRVEYQQSFR